MKNIMVILSSLMFPLIGYADNEGELEKPGDVRVINPHFVTEIYDWELDYMLDGSIFAVDLESEGATDYEVEIVNRFPYPFFSVEEFDEHFNSPYTYSIYYCSLTPVGEPNHFEYPAEWGEMYRFQGHNKAGYSKYSKPYLSTDYITDPAILARIKELENIYTGIEDIVQELDPAADLIHKFGDTLKVSPDVSEVRVYDEKGVSLRLITDPQEEISISDIGSGVYFAVAKTADGLSKILKFIR